MTPKLRRFPYTFFPCIVLIAAHFILFTLLAPSSIQLFSSTERYVWNILLSPFLLLATCLVTIGTGLYITHKEKGDVHIPYISLKREIYFLFYCLLCSLLFNIYSIRSLEQLPLTCLFVAGGICISLAFFGKFARLCLAPFIFLSLVAIAAYYMKIDLSYGNLVELFGATWEDAKDFVTPINSVLLIISIIVSLIWIQPIFICLRGISSSRLLLQGGIYLMVSLALLQVSEQHIQKDKHSLWPIGTCTSICYNACRALKIIHTTKELFKYLPPKEAAKLDTLPTISPDDGIICILHIGESMRADHLSINGYKRVTTPRLAKLDGVISFSDCTASASTTDRATLVMLTNSRRDYVTNPSKEYAASSPPLPDFFASSTKFKTASFWAAGSLQRGAAPLWVEEVKFYTRSIEETQAVPGLPLEQLPLIKAYISKHESNNLFILLNNRGSHSPFNEFDTKNAHFPVSQTITLDLSQRKNTQDIHDLLNAYDNTAYELDMYISELIEHMRGKPFLYVYMSDHGEYVGEEGYWYRVFTPERLFFRSPACKVPFIIYASPELLAMNQKYRENIDHLRNHKDIRIGQEHLFHTLLGFFDLKTPYYVEELDLTSDKVQPYKGPHPSRAGNSEDGTK